MAQSFGYFVDAVDDRRVLAEVARILAAGGASCSISSTVT